MRKKLLSISNEIDNYTSFIKYQSKGTNLGRLNEYGYSTKGEGRGLGLYNVKEILKKYRNVSKSTSISEGYFEQTLILQK